MKTNFILNSKEVSTNSPKGKLLIDILREEFHLTGTKKGCRTGECGSCTVILNGKAVHSCLITLAQVENKKILTIEGLKENGEYDILQRKFIEHGAVQCGYCTPGMILSAKSLLLSNRNPTESEIRESISGNLCRCTGYSKIVAAILDISGNMEKSYELS